MLPVAPALLRFTYMRLDSRLHTLKYLAFALLISATLSTATAAELCSRAFAPAPATARQELVISKTAVNAKAFDLLQSATKSIDLSISSIPNDGLVNILQMKARQGVHIRLLLDGRHFTKNREMTEQYSRQLRTLQHPNIDIRMTSPLSLAANRQYHAAVLHRKLIIVDGNRAYAGSSNLTDFHNNVEIGLFTAAHLPELQQIFANDFQRTERRSFQIARQDSAMKTTSSLWLGPGTQRPDLQGVILETIEQCREHLWLHLYELSAPKVIKALVKKKKTHPETDIRILINAEPVALWAAGQKFMHNTNEESIQALTTAGIPVRVYEERGMLPHGRFLLSEQDLVAGSFDFSERSFRGNIDFGFHLTDKTSLSYAADQYLDLWGTATEPQKNAFKLENSLANFLETKILPHLKVRSAPQAKLDITYGWEVEFDPRESPRVLDYYRLKSINESRWRQMGSDEKVQTLQESLRRLPKVLRAGLSFLGFPALKKLSDAPAWLPDQAPLESHGMVELVGDVETEFTGLEIATARIENLIGRGYWQGHVAFPKIYSENISGWISFTSDLALLKHLESTYQSYMKNSQQLPAAVLVHYAVGPLDVKTLTHIQEREANAARGKSIGSGGRERLIYGPAFRDDAYPDGLAGIELRQFSKRREELLRETENFSRLLTRNQLFHYNAFKQTRMLDHKVYERLSAADRPVWRYFFAEVNDFLKAQSSHLITGGAGYDLRFLVPLRPWLDHPALRLSKLSESEKEISRGILNTAEIAFIAEVNGIIKSPESMNQKVAQLRVAVARWADTVKLSELLSEF